MPVSICTSFVAVLHDLEALFERTLRVDTDILRAMLRDVEFKKDLDALSDPDLQPDEQDRYTQHRASWTAVVGECRQVSDSTAATGARLEAFCLDLETKLAFYHSNCFPGPLRQLVTLLSRVCHHPFRTLGDECHPEFVRAILAVSRVVKSLRAVPRRAIALSSFFHVVGAAPARDDDDDQGHAENETLPFASPSHERQHNFTRRRTTRPLATAEKETLLFASPSYERQHNFTRRRTTRPSATAEKETLPFASPSYERQHNFIRRRTTRPSATAETETLPFASPSYERQHNFIRRRTTRPSATAYNQPLTMSHSIASTLREGLEPITRATKQPEVLSSWRGEQVSGHGTAEQVSGHGTAQAGAREDCGAE
ncbi:unnamed protein product [Zymoseptoria tritici ST99CH_3D1]|nr:unnamed protein product [Zymoseptoria tritici ST99CH_3D1]